MGKKIIVKKSRKKKNITENKISVNNIEMCDIREYLNTNDINHMPCPLKEGCPKKSWDFDIKWELYRRKSKKGKTTYIPKFEEFETLTKEEIKKRHKYYNDSKKGVIDTYRILEIDIDSPDYDDWLKDLLKTAPYYKSLTKEFGRHIFIKLKEGQHLEKTSDYFDDKISLKYGKKKIEVFQGKWCFFDINSKVYNCNNEIPIIDLNEHPLLKEKETNKETKEGMPCLGCSPIWYDEKKKTLSKLDFKKLTEYTEVIADKYWENYDDWFKIMCAWKYLGASFEQFQKVALTKKGNKTNNETLWNGMTNAYVGWRVLTDYAKRSNQEKTLQLDNKFNSFEKFDKYVFMKKCDFKCKEKYEIAKSKINAFELQIKDLTAEIADCESKKKKAKLKEELDEIRDALSAEKEGFRSITENHCRGEYKARKEYFEKFHFKVIDPICYARKRYTDFQLYNKAGFMEVYNYLKVDKINKQGELKPSSFIKAWLDDIDILEYNKVDFLPPPLQVPEETHNLFCGLAAENYMNETTTVLDENGNPDISVFLNHIKLLAGKEEAIRGMNPAEYLLKYFAHMVQFPGTKPGVSITQCGIQGTGKSMFWGEFGRKVLGGEYTLQTARMKDLTGTFSKINHKILVISEETDCGDTFKNAGLLKDLITSETNMFEKKCKDAIPQRSVLRLAKLTNGVTPNVEMNDRRECIIVPAEDMVLNLAKTDEEREKRFNYFANLKAAFDDKARVYAFYLHLMFDVDLSDFNIVNDRPLTRSYFDIQSVNISIYKRFLNYKCSVGKSSVCEIESDDDDYNELDNDAKSSSVEGIKWAKCLGIKAEETKVIKIKSYKLYEEFKDWIHKYKPKISDTISSTSMGRWLGKYEPVKKDRTESGVEYTIDIQKVRDDCEQYSDFLY